jgi:hypothetical protein
VAGLDVTQHPASADRGELLRSAAPTSPSRLSGRPSTAYRSEKSSSSASQVEMDIRVPIPLDEEGFVRRQCSKCRWEFKWHYGPANEEAEAEPSAAVYYCPLCGEPAPSDSDA